MRIFIAGLTLSAMLIAGGGALAGERVAADVSCAATTEKLTYDCMIMLKGKKSGEPVEGAKVVVKADMPSMPLAHNVRPVKAAAGSMPGHYTATLKLEMLGGWALTLDVSGPTRDRVVKKLDFGPTSGKSGHGRGKTKDHGGHKDRGGMKTEEAR